MQLELYGQMGIKIVYILLRDYFQIKFRVLKINKINDKLEY